MRPGLFEGLLESVSRAVETNFFWTILWILLLFGEQRAQKAQRQLILCMNRGRVRSKPNKTTAKNASHPG